MMTELFQNRASNTLGKVACQTVPSYSVTPSPVSVSVKTLDFQELQLVVTGRERGRRVEQTNCLGINRDGS